MKRKAQGTKHRKDKIMTPSPEKQETTYDDLKSNTEKNVFENLNQILSDCPFSPVETMRNFPVFTPRQTVARFLNRYEMYKKIIDIQGSIFEFGVFRGAGAFSWLHFSTILEPYNLNRKIFCFDTFEGFPEVCDKDDGVFQTGDLGETSYETLVEAAGIHQKNIPIGHIDRMSFIKGDITETLPTFLEENAHIIASLIYIDVDIYKPTKIILENMISRIPKGGIIAFDELNDEYAKGETVALLEKINLNSVQIKRNYFDSNPCYIII